MEGDVGQTMGCGDQHHRCLRREALAPCSKAAVEEAAGAVVEVAVGPEAETVGVVEAVEAARPPPRKGDEATLGGGNEEWQ